MESKRLLNIAKRLEGLQTVRTIQKELGVGRSAAIKTVCMLKKKGLVKTTGGGKKPRIYRIKTTPIIEIGSPGLHETINKYSSIKLVKPFEHRIIGRKMSIEEAIVRAVASKRFRLVLASLGLFNHVRNWHRLYFYAKKYDVRKKVGALYDVAREMIKTKKMDKRTRNALMKSKEKGRFIIKNIKSNDFLDIQDEWKIYVPFNKADLWRYKE